MYVVVANGEQLARSSYFWREGVRNSVFCTRMVQDTAAFVGTVVNICSTMSYVSTYIMELNLLNLQ